MANDHGQEKGCLTDDRFRREHAIAACAKSLSGLERTFSAAQNATNRLERETFALFVGEPSGGAPNHYGDGQVNAGATTGLTSLISTLPWFDSYPQDGRVWVMLDLPSPQLFADWRDGSDPALQIALTHVSNAPADEWNADNTFYFMRPSQGADWRPFWRQA
ncbi:MAG: hypothetical protein ABL871_14115 [Terricaulis sp.]